MILFVTYLKRFMAVAILSGIATLAFADDAPVYEVDNYPPPFDSQPEVSGGMITDSTELSAPPPSPQAAYVPEPPPVHVHKSPASQEFYTPPPTRSLSTSERLAKLERQMNNLQQINSSAKNEELQKEVQSLRGQVEELTHQLRQAQNQQRSLYADLDQRLTGMTTAKPAPKLQEESESVHPKEPTPTIAKATTKPSVNSTATASAKTPAAAVEQPNAAEEQQIYQSAYDLIKTKKYNEAIAMLQKMLKKYPTGQSAANAHYWLGELYGLLNKNEQSAAEFTQIINNFPNSPKVSDASLKLGLIYVAEFKWTEAKTIFKKVVKQYPGTASARLATEQLKQIKQAGH